MSIATRCLRRCRIYVHRSSCSQVHFPSQLACTRVQLAPPLQNGLVDPLWPYGEYPGLAAGGEDWAFQGTDMAFFENLMRGAGDDGVYWTVEASSR
ncbi:hypothetical protein V1519DRAFT_456148 [Lipomyces tetrasporus]